MKTQNKSYPKFSFFSQKGCVGTSRVGKIHTPHGIITTPNFIFCATKASIKCIPSYQVAKIGAQIILSNTYHLMLRPGAAHIAKRGGLHSFMHWDKPLFTDSGGYQIFAMGHGSVSQEIKKNNTHTIAKNLVSITEEGVMFKSYIDGSKHFLSPEKSIDIQAMLGADLIVQLDECTAFHLDKKYTADSMRQSVRWGDRSLKHFFTSHNHNYNQAMYGVIQGGVYEDLRKESITRVQEQNFFATAIGGSLGSNKNQMYDVINFTSTTLENANRPVHLLGIGDIADIFYGIELGIDTFDCVHPTRIARHACAIIPASLHPDQNGNVKLNLRNKQFKDDDTPLDGTCCLPCCKKYSRAYLHYLCKAKEFLGPYLLTVHNIGQMVRLMREIRSVLTQDKKNYYDLKKFWLT